MKNKKGISAIVATVLIILITVAAVTIIWAAIIPMISTQLQSGTVCLDAVSQVQLLSTGYTCFNDVGDNVSIQVKHGAGSFVLNDIQVLVSAGGSTTVFSVIDNSTATLSDLPGPNEERVFEVEIGTLTNVDKVQIAPIVQVGNTQETCGVSATKVIQACS